MNVVNFLDFLVDIFKFLESSKEPRAKISQDVRNSPEEIENFFQLLKESLEQDVKDTKDTKEKDLDQFKNELFEDEVRTAKRLNVK